MTSVETKGKSPFYPGQPVPVDLFRGRQQQIERILTRGAAQVAAGKPVTMYVEGEYGIGKSSIAAYAQYLLPSRTRDSTRSTRHWELRAT